MKTPQHHIDRFVESKKKWIEECLAKTAERTERREAFSLNYGDMIRYRGKEYPIKIKPGEYIGYTDGEFYTPPGLTPEEIKAAVVEVYRMLAKRDLTIKTVYFASVMDVEPIAIKVNNAKSRWGSCSGKKRINYSWYLIMADDALIEYVIVHELAHLLEMNHSTQFWNIVEEVLPDYRIRKQRLKDLQKIISNENWET